MKNHIKNSIWGVVVGDALGVPVEFNSREYLKQNPLTDMIGYGTYNQPPGTWSDDSSLTLCLADELSKGFNLQAIADSFVKWLNENHWTPHNEVFDVGIGTREAIFRLQNGEKPELAGGISETSNGNGSLMRILPLVFETIKLKTRLERFELIQKVSSITHRHIRSCLACFYYLEFASYIISNESKSLNDAYLFANKQLLNLFKEISIPSNEIEHFERLTTGKIKNIDENKIYSSGYVIHTLEASIWSLLNTKSYSEAVLKAINLGEDTDTTGAVTGGLAGLFYDFENIPKDWIEQIAKNDEIDNLINKLSEFYN